MNLNILAKLHQYISYCFRPNCYLGEDMIWSCPFYPLEHSGFWDCYLFVKTLWLYYLWTKEAKPLIDCRINTRYVRNRESLMFSLDCWLIFISMHTSCCNNITQFFFDLHVGGGIRLSLKYQIIEKNEDFFAYYWIVHINHLTHFIILRIPLACSYSS